MATLRGTEKRIEGEFEAYSCSFTQQIFALHIRSVSAKIFAYSYSFAHAGEGYLETIKRNVIYGCYFTQKGEILP